jgi:hypothetical protein
MIRMSVENPRYDYDRWPPRLGEAHAATTVRPLDARSRGRNTIGTIWQIFGNSEYGLGRFEVAAPAALPQQQRFRLAFRLLQWRWDWSASPSLRLFRTCLEMSSSRRCERPHKDGDRQMT